MHCSMLQLTYAYLISMCDALENMFASLKQKSKQTNINQKKNHLILKTLKFDQDNYTYFSHPNFGNI